MLGALLITWREGIEAFLIVGILLTYLAKINQVHHGRYVHAGTAAALAASLVFAYFSNLLEAVFQGIGQELFHAAILGLATVVLTQMVLWMHHHARELKGQLQTRTDEAIATRRLWGLALLAFLGVFREGVETVLFLWGLVLHTRTSLVAAGPLAGGLLGLALAVVTTWLFFKGFGHLDLRAFFRVTGVLLCIMAAGMLASASGRLIAAGVLPPLIEPVWNTAWLLDESRLPGSLLAGLFGYRSRPSLVEVLCYVSYFPVTLLLARWYRQHTVAAR